MVDIAITSDNQGSRETTLIGGGGLFIESPEYAIFKKFLGGGVGPPPPPTPPSSDAPGDNCCQDDKLYFVFHQNYFALFQAII